MASEKSQPEEQLGSTAVESHTSSCRKHRAENATFFEDVKDHIHDFIHASLDDHKACFKKGIQKVDSSFYFVAMQSLSPLCCNWCLLIFCAIRCLGCQKLEQKGVQKWRRLKVFSI